MSRIPLLLVAALALLACDTGGGTPPSADVPTPTAPVCKNPNRDTVNQLNAPPAITIDVNKSYTARLNTARGSFTIKLNPHAAPSTVNNFVYLAQQKYYDCLTFHRVVPQFVVQGGDPLGNGTGGPAYKLPNETNSTPWRAGSSAMASSQAGVSGSQFFITIGDAPFLAGSGVYNHFGQITSGMDVLDKIQVGDQMTSIDITAS